jgi:hypothetical protein
MKELWLCHVYYVWANRLYHPNGSMDADQCPAFDSEFITILIKQQTIDGGKTAAQVGSVCFVFFLFNGWGAKFYHFPSSNFYKPKISTEKIINQICAYFEHQPDLRKRMCIFYIDYG